jgi:hypothetical protein
MGDVAEASYYALRARTAATVHTNTYEYPGTGMVAPRTPNDYYNTRLHTPQQRVKKPATLGDWARESFALCPLSYSC